MELPDKIFLQAKCDEHRKLNGLIFVMQVQAGTKNPYLVRFPKTDINGLAVLEAEDFRGQFNEHHDLALMDYNGSVESACQTVEISLLNVKQMAKSGALDWPLTQSERNNWKSKQQKADYFLSSTNEKFIFLPAAVRIESGRAIEVTVGQTSGTAQP